MSEDPYVSLDEAMKELQVDQDELKELFRKNALRYVLEEGKIKIPRMALMALKLERMTSTTQQFAKVKRSMRKRSLTQQIMGEENLASLDEALQTLSIEKAKLQELITAKQVRYVEIGGEYKFYQTSLQALKLQLASFISPPKLSKNNPAIKRVS
jgi:chromosome segregation ATPase